MFLMMVIAAVAATHNQEERRMTSIDMINDSFTCRQDADLAIITFLKGAKKIATILDAKDALLMALRPLKTRGKLTVLLSSIRMNSREVLSTGNFC